MWRELSIVGLAVALVTATGAAIVSDGTSEAQASGTSDVVMREPRVGDRASFEYTGGSFQGDEGPWTFERAWNSSTVQLPDGTERTLPTLSQWSPATVRTEDDGMIERHRYTSLLHFTQLPGNVSAITFNGSFSGEGDDESFTHRYDHTRIQDREGCSGPLAARLVGQTPDQARAAIRACQWAGVDQLSDVTVDIESEWRDNETYGEIWVAHVNASATTPDEDTIYDNETIVTSPERSMPVAVVQPGDPEDPGDRTNRRVMTSWSDGDEPLATEPDPLPEMPRIGVVDWTSRGPQGHALNLYPIAEARDAIEREPEGRAFFETADETRIGWASFVDQDQEISVPRSSSWSEGVECSPEDQAASVQAPEPAGTRTWSIEWVSPDNGMLWGDAETPRVAQDNPTGQRLPVAQADAYHDEDDADEEGWSGMEIPPGERGPALDELWAQRSLLDAFELEGTTVLEVRPAYVLEPYGEPDARPLVGAIGTVDCVDHADDEGDTTRELRIRFDQDGQATSVERSVSSWSHPGVDHLPPEGIPPSAIGFGDELGLLR